MAHIWELGGGSHVSDLVRVPITPDRFHDALYVIVVDLSKPSSVIPHLLHWTDQIKVYRYFSSYMITLSTSTEAVVWYVLCRTAVRTAVVYTWCNFYTERRLKHDANGCGAAISRSIISACVTCSAHIVVAGAGSVL